MTFLVKFVSLYIYMGKMLEDRFLKLLKAWLKLTVYDQCSKFPLVTIKFLFSMGDLSLPLGYVHV